MLGAVELSKTVPVDGSTIVGEVVGDVDLEVVTPVGLDAGLCQQEERTHT